MQYVVPGAKKSLEVEKRQASLLWHPVVEERMKRELEFVYFSFVLIYITYWKS